MSVTIYHNPRCSKSRQTLALIRDAGIEPDIVEYLDNPPSADELKRITDLLGLAPAQLLRSSEPTWRETGLDADSLEPERLIDIMSEHPILIQRPIVIVGDQARLGRPPEAVAEILP